MYTNFSTSIDFPKALYDIFLNYNYHTICDVSVTAMQSCVANGNVPVSYTAIGSYGTCGSVLHVSDLIRPGIGLELIFLGCCGVVFFVILAVIEGTISLRTAAPLSSDFISRKRDGNNIMVM